MFKSLSVSAAAVLGACTVRHPELLSLLRLSDYAALLRDRQLGSHERASGHVVGASFALCSDCR